MRLTPFLLCAAAIVACAPADDQVATDTGAAAPAAAADPDLATNGGGIPTGYRGQVDIPRPGRDAANLQDASYRTENGRWVVRTGPAHIIWSPQDSASGSYTATATIEQLERPQHPEAFGLVIGGQQLDSLATQRYTYFIVRHTGEYMVRVREGENLRTIADWTPSPAVPQADDAGRARYELSARVAQDSVQFLVNGQQVHAAPRASVLTDGHAGLRINHNLHLAAEPVRITR